MIYPLVAIGLAIVFFVYLLYLYFIKKDKAKAKSVLLPGLFFLGIWVVFYYMVFR